MNKRKLFVYKMNILIVLRKIIPLYKIQIRYSFISLMLCILFVFIAFGISYNLNNDFSNAFYKFGILIGFITVMENFVYIILQKLTINI
jgi:hypothetical protein